MKIIDSKGKLFGKINVLDLTVLIVLVLLIGVGTKYLLTMGKPTTLYVQLQLCENENNRIENCGNVPSYYLDAIVKGDTVLSNKNVVGEIIDRYGLKKTDNDFAADIRVIVKLNVLEKKGVFLFNKKPLRLKELITLDADKISLTGVVREFDYGLSSVGLEYQVKEIRILSANQPIDIITNFEKGAKELGIDNETIALVSDYEAYPTINPNKDAILTAKLKSLFIENSYWFKGRKLKIGEPIIIENEYAAIKGTVISLDAESPEKSEQIVSIKIYDQPEFIADKIIVGAKEVDSKGRVLGEVLSKTVQNAKHEIATETGQLVLAESHLNKDIIIDVLLSVEKKGDESFFHADNLKVGKNIYLSLNHIDISGKIIDIR